MLKKKGRPRTLNTRTKENERPFDLLIQDKCNKLEKAINCIDNSLKGVVGFIEKAQDNIQVLSKSNLESNATIIRLEARIKKLEALQPKPEIYNDFYVINRGYGNSVIYYGAPDNDMVIGMVEHYEILPRVVTLNDESRNQELIEEIAGLQTLTKENIVWYTDVCFSLSRSMIQDLIEKDELEERADNDKGKEEC